MLVWIVQLAGTKGTPIWIHKNKKPSTTLKKAEAEKGLMTSFAKDSTRAVTEVPKAEALQRPGHFSLSGLVNKAGP